VYRYVAGRLRKKLILTTLKTGNTNYTTDIQSTINQIIEHFVPEDSEDGEEAHHKHVRQQASAPLQTTDDVEFTRHEVQATLEKFDPRKTPGEDACPVRCSCMYTGASPPLSRRSTTSV